MAYNVLKNRFELLCFGILRCPTPQLVPNLQMQRISVVSSRTQRLLHRSSPNSTLAPQFVQDDDINFRGGDRVERGLRGPRLRSGCSAMASATDAEVAWVER